MPMLALITHLVQEGEDFLDCKHQQWVVHQRQEQCDQPVQVSQRDIPSLVDQMGRPCQEHTQLARKPDRQSLMRRLSIQNID